MFWCFHLCLELCGFVVDAVVLNILLQEENVVESNNVE